MEDNQNIPASPDFSDIPALNDVSGLEAYLNNEALAAQGLPVQPSTTQPDAPASQPAVASQPSADIPAQPAAPAQGDTITLTREQLNAILASGQASAPGAQQAKPQAPVQQKEAAYTAQEQQFIAKALAQGYSLRQINDFLVRQRGSQGTMTVNPALEQRLAQVEQYLKTQEYKAAETAFINRLSDFGSKWGLSEQDLVTFGNEALKQGINIAVGDVNLETVFRAVYPDQYAIRLKRMTPTTSSQIYGGTSIPEGNRTNASKIEDAYVDAFLKGTMPNQYAAFNKK